jgi:hypothetical protein
MPSSQVFGQNTARQTIPGVNYTVSSAKICEHGARSQQVLQDMAKRVQPDNTMINPPITGI